MDTTTPQSGQSAAPIAVAQPSAIVSATPVGPASSVAPSPQVPLAAQVAAPLFTLAGVKPGEHVLTINVTPDNLGPVTVRAHVTVDSVRVELFAPNDAGRDALRAILPDLRRDLAGSGLNANLNLSSQNQASEQGASGQGRQALTSRTVQGQPAELPVDAAPRATTFGLSSTIDVLA
jgi:flagellar hook-length control protein FliK